METTCKPARQTFVPGTSQFPRNPRTLALQMAMERKRQLEVADRIRSLRGPKPQPVIADEVGVRLRTYQHWEAGDGIAWENLQKLASVFGVTENYLLYGHEAPVGPESQLDRIEAGVEEILRQLAAAAPAAKRGRPAQPLVETAKQRADRAKARTRRAAGAGPNTSR